MSVDLHADPRFVSTVRFNVHINRFLAIPVDQHSDVRAYCTVRINGWINARVNSVRKDVYLSAR